MRICYSLPRARCVSSALIGNSLCFCFAPKLCHFFFFFLKSGANNLHFQCCRITQLEHGVLASTALVLIIESRNEATLWNWWLKGRPRQTTWPPCFVAWVNDSICRLLRVLSYVVYKGNENNNWVQALVNSMWVWTIALYFLSLCRLFSRPFPLCVLR